MADAKPDSAGARDGRSGGAHRGHPSRDEVGDSKRALAGLVLGIGGALALARVLQTLLYGVEPGDPLTFAGVSLLLAVIALFACWLPARRAARVEPMEALRYE